MNFITTDILRVDDVDWESFTALWYAWDNYWTAVLRGLMRKGTWKKRRLWLCSPCLPSHRWLELCLFVRNIITLVWISDWSYCCCCCCCCCCHCWRRRVWRGGGVKMLGAGSCSFPMDSWKFRFPTAKLVSRTFTLNSRIACVEKLCAIYSYTLHLSAYRHCTSKCAQILRLMKQSRIGRTNTSLFHKKKIFGQAQI